MKTRVLTVLIGSLLVTLASLGCGSPTEPTPEMVILSPKPNAQLKIGEMITIQWQCVACKGIKGDRAVVKLNSRISGGQCEITTGFLTDSRSWVVGDIKYARYATTVSPGFYYIEVSSYPPPSDTSWTEATSGFGGVLIEIVH